MRLFIAINLEEQLKQELNRVQSTIKKRASERISFTNPDNLHLTLKFIGEISEELLKDISDKLREIIPTISAFKIRLFDTGVFPESGSVRIIWAGLKEETGTLMKAVTLIEERLRLLNISSENRPYSPHITLGRVKEKGHGDKLRRLVTETKPKPLEQEVYSITLMSSILKETGSEYSKIEEFLLSNS